MNFPKETSPGSVKDLFPMLKKQIMNEKCPYNIGDKVKFSPFERTERLYQNIERFGLKVCQIAIIQEIRDDVYLYFENGTGGFLWNEFTIVNNIQ